jgi:hypothetical protein
MSRFSRTGWAKIPTPVQLLAVSPEMIAYQREVSDGHLSVFVGPEDGDWHLSISHRRADGTPGRYPSWDEIRDARDEFCPPKATMAMILPPKSEYVNVHETTFHLFEIEGDR